MASRRLALVAFVLTAGYALVYVAAVRRQGGPVAWWYLGFLAIAAVALLVATAGYRPRGSLLVAVVVLWLGVLVGLLSVGLALLPAALVGAVAWFLVARRPVDRGPTRVDALRR